MRRIKSTDRPPPGGARWLVKGLARPKGVALLFGPAGAGKSTVAADLACHSTPARRGAG